MDTFEFYHNIIVLRDELGEPLTIYTYKLDYYNCEIIDKFYLNEDVLFDNYKISRFYHDKINTLLKQYSFGKIWTYDFNYLITSLVSEYTEIYKNSKIDWNKERISKFYFDENWNLNFTLIDSIYKLSEVNPIEFKLYDYCCFSSICHHFSYVFNLLLKYPEEFKRISLSNKLISKNMFEINLQNYDSQLKYIDVFSACNSFYKLEYVVEDKYIETIFVSLNKIGNVVCFFYFRDYESNIKLSA